MLCLNVMRGCGDHSPLTENTRNARVFQPDLRVSPSASPQNSVGFCGQMLATKAFVELIHKVRTKAPKIFVGPRSPPPGRRRDSPPVEPLRLGQITRGALVASI